MKRHSALLPLTHDHHHALVWARRLRLAADADEGSRLETASGFLTFFDTEAIRHFREEEELLFPLLAEAEGTVPDEVAQLLVQHLEIHALVHRLRRRVAAGSVPAADVATLGQHFEVHIRLEEHQVFPHIEETVPDADLSALHLAHRDRPEAPAGNGPAGVSGPT